MIQTCDLKEIVKIHGTVNIIDNPATKSELLEILGPRLAMFWKINADTEEFVILETVIQMAEYYKPMNGIVETVIFPQEQEHGS